MRKTLSLNENWLFTRQGQDPCTVQLPHTWNAQDGQSGTSMWRGVGRYEKRLTFTPEDLQSFLYLEIGAASLVSRVYVNGQLAAENRFPFSLYRLPLNDWLQPGENTLLLEADNAECDNVYPRMADFSFYGGVYRDVRLIADGPIHFTETDRSRAGVQVRTSKKADGSWELQVTGTLVNHGSDCPGRVTVRLTDADTDLTAQCELQLTAQTPFAVHLDVPSPHLWQGTADPHLYTAEVQAWADQTLLDTRCVETAFREICITPDKGLFLNGQHLKLRGVARHQDFGGVGNAVTPAQMDTDLALIQELGANSVRLSHYQHDDYFYTLCDRAGILVWAEVPFISLPFTEQAGMENIEGQMECLVKQCGNHPSIYCWGVQNEITIAGESPEIHQMVQHMAQYTKKLDPTRYTAEANIYSVENQSPLNRLADLVGYNLYYGWYYQNIPDLQVRLDTFHAQCPDIPLMVTEYGVDTNPALHSYEPSVKDYTEEYQLLFSDNALRAFEERDFMVGSYVWNMADFGSAARNEGGKTGQNQKGLVTIDRQLKKDAFYLYKAYWSAEKFVKLAGSRFVHRHRECNDLTALSNLAKLALYVNGTLVQQTQQVQPMTTFAAVPLQMGENEILLQGWDEDGNLYEDRMTLCRVEQPDTSYVLPKTAGTRATNWFEGMDLPEVEPFELDENCYSSRDKVGVLLKNPQAHAVLSKYFGRMLDDPRRALMESMTIDAMSKLRNLGMPQGLVDVLNRELNKIPKD